MSIFARRETESPKPPTPTPSQPPAPRTAAPAPASSRDKTHIARGSKVVGEVSGAAELEIDGLVEGKIDLDSRLVVGASGKVEGEVKARSIQISGRVHGNVRAVDRVEVLKSGRLEGDMMAPQNGVHIAEGAFFTGKIDMSRSSADARPAKPERPEDSKRPGANAPPPRQSTLAGSGSQDAGSQDAGSQDAGSKDARSKDAGSSGSDSSGSKDRAEGRPEK